MKKVVPFLRFGFIRFLERNCHPRNLYRLLLPLARVRAAFKKIPAGLTLPEIIGTGTVIPGTAKCWQNYYLNRALTAFPERLAAPEWLEHCTFSGLEGVREAQRQGRPSVIVISHFGPYYLLRPWLRAAGIRAAALVSGHADERTYMEFLKDRVKIFPDIPAVFHRHQLREVKKFLAAGNTLVITLDGVWGNQIEIPAGRQFRFRMATGALRLAAHEGAGLYPGNIIDTGHWRFRIELGRPVPAEFLSGRPAFTPAGKHLLDEMLPCFRSYPEQCSLRIFNNFQEVDMPDDSAAAGQPENHTATI